MEKVRAILYKVGENPEVVEITRRGSEINELIGADCTDSSIINIEADHKSEYFRAIVDDEGILINKKRNRGFFGDFVVCKCDEYGFFTDMSDREVESILEFFIDADIKHKNPVVEKFLNDLHNKIGGNVRTYDFDDTSWFNMVSVSFAEVFEELRKNQSNRELNNGLLRMAELYNGGIMSLESVTDVMEDFRKQLAEFRHDIMKQQFGA